MGVNASREFNFVVPVCLYRKQVFTFTEKFMFNVCQQSHVGNVLTFRSNKFGTKLLFGLVFFLFVPFFVLHFVLVFRKFALDCLQL